jgi:hypothetical protein
MCKIQINRNNRLCGGVDRAKLSDDRLHVLAFVRMEQILGFYFVSSLETISSSSNTLHHGITHLFTSTNEANSDKDAHEFTFLQQ